MDLENLVAQQNERIAQLTEMLAGFLMQKELSPIHNKTDVLEDSEVPRKLKYGQGSITKRFRLTFINENGDRKIKAFSDESKAKKMASKYEKSNLYRWYQVSWFDEYGKRHSKTAKTLLLAHEIIDENNKRSMKKSRKDLKTFGEAMREWYQAFRVEDCCEERNKINIREIDRLPNNIANKALQAVTTQELQTHLNNIECDTPKVVAKTLLASFLRYSFLQGLIKKDIGALLKAPSLKAAEKQVLSINNEQKFLELLPKKFRDPAIGLIYTGCRYSEFIGIQEEDIDRINKTILIRETKSVRANDRRKGITFKTRTIPLLPEVEKLKFPMPYISQAYFQISFKRASKALGIKVSPHDMRHTFATRCDDLGIKEKVIQSILGHKTPRMTEHYKNHKSAELLENEFEKIRKSTAISTAIRVENDAKSEGTMSKKPKLAQKDTKNSQKN